MRISTEENVRESEIRVNRKLLDKKFDINKLRHVESISDFYTIQNELAKSRFGTIKYAVNNFIPGRKHAIKVIKKQVLASNPDYETIILKDIHHLGIINVNEILQDADYVYIVMDYENYL